MLRRTVLELQLITTLNVGFSFVFSQICTSPPQLGYTEVTSTLLCLGFYNTYHCCSFAPTVHTTPEFFECLKQRILEMLFAPFWFENSELHCSMEEQKRLRHLGKP